MTLNEAFDRLNGSKFRSRFKLTAKELAYINRVGMETIECHAVDFVRDKLAADFPLNDGKQTPMHGHPAFKAMHATATCCRSCMEKWWKVPKGHPLSPSQQAKAVRLIMTWIDRNLTRQPHQPSTTAQKAPKTPPVRVGHVQTSN